jgi:hypothetical protein
MTLLFVLGACLFVALLLSASLNKSYFHLAAFQTTTAGAVTNSALGAVADGILTQATATAFIAPAGAQLYWVYGGAVLLSRLRFNTPSFRLVSLPSMIPVNLSLTVPSPPNVVDLTPDPLIIPKVDLISMEATDTQAAGESINALMCLMFDFKACPQTQLENGRQVPAKRYRIRGTAAIAQAAGAWVSGGITLDQPLQNGQYVIVNMDVVAANVVGARLIFAGTGYRPGILARNSIGAVRHRLFDGDAMGCYGTFENVNTPNLEVFSVGAGASQEVFLDVIRVGEPGESPGL